MRRREREREREIKFLEAKFAAEERSRFCRLRKKEEKVRARAKGTFREIGIFKRAWALVIDYFGKVFSEILVEEQREWESDREFQVRVYSTWLHPDEEEAKDIVNMNRKTIYDLRQDLERRKHNMAGPGTWQWKKAKEEYEKEALIQQCKVNMQALVQRGEIDEDTGMCSECYMFGEEILKHGAHGWLGECSWAGHWEHPSGQLQEQAHQQDQLQPPTLNTTYSNQMQEDDDELPEEYEDFTPQGLDEEVSPVRAKSSSSSSSSRSSSRSNITDWNNRWGGDTTGATSEPTPALCPPTPIVIPSTPSPRSTKRREAWLAKERQKMKDGFERYNMLDDDVDITDETVQAATQARRSAKEAICIRREGILMQREDKPAPTHRPRSMKLPIESKRIPMKTMAIFKRARGLHHLRSNCPLYHTPRTNLITVTDEAECLFAIMELLTPNELLKLTAVSKDLNHVWKDRDSGTSEAHQEESQTVDAPLESLLGHIFTAQHEIAWLILQGLDWDTDTRSLNALSRQWIFSEYRLHHRRHLLSQQYCRKSAHLSLSNLAPRCSRQLYFQSFTRLSVDI